jgi:hypothetical protein
MRAYLGLLALLLGGCCRTEPSSSRDGWFAQPRNTSGSAPPVLAMQTPLPWPPLGPASKVVFSASATEDDLALATVTFRKGVTRSTSGRSATFQIPAAELGEGRGPLKLEVANTRGARAGITYPNTLIDLTPPQILAVPRTTLRHGEDRFGFWAGDAWVLGAARLQVAGRSMTHTFPERYPQTIGSAWDISWVSFELIGVPPGEHEATITLEDAAGSSVTTTRPLRIDGEAPVAQILAPAPGAEVTGAIEVQLAAQDDFDGPLRFELFAGGTPVASVPGPEATVLLDATLFPAGALTLSVIAFDEAGNPSEEVEVEVMLP